MTSTNTTASFLQLERTSRRSGQGARNYLEADQADLEVDLEADAQQIQAALRVTLAHPPLQLEKKERRILPLIAAGVLIHHFVAAAAVHGVVGGHALGHAGAVAAKALHGSTAAKAVATAHAAHATWLATMKSICHQCFGSGPGGFHAWLKGQIANLGSALQTQAQTCGENLAGSAIKRITEPLKVTGIPSAVEELGKIVLDTKEAMPKGCKCEPNKVCKAPESEEKCTPEQIQAIATDLVTAVAEDVGTLATQSTLENTEMLLGPKGDTFKEDAGNLVKFIWTQASCGGFTDRVDGAVEALIEGVATGGQAAEPAKQQITGESCETNDKVTLANAVSAFQTMQSGVQSLESEFDTVMETTKAGFQASNPEEHFKQYLQTNAENIGGAVCQYLFSKMLTAAVYGVEKLAGTEGTVAAVSSFGSRILACLCTPDDSSKCEELFKKGADEVVEVSAAKIMAGKYRCDGQKCAWSPCASDDGKVLDCCAYMGGTCDTNNCGRKEECENSEAAIAEKYPKERCDGSYCLAGSCSSVATRWKQFNPKSRSGVPDQSYWENSQTGEWTYTRPADYNPEDSVKDCCKYIFTGTCDTSNCITEEMTAVPFYAAQRAPCKRK
jgi:hypothetical protein